MKSSNFSRGSEWYWAMTLSHKLHFCLAFRNSATSFIPSPAVWWPAVLEEQPPAPRLCLCPGRCPNWKPWALGPRFGQGAQPHKVRLSGAGAQAPWEPLCMALPNCTTVATRRQPETGDDRNTYTTKSGERYKPRVSVALFLKGE